MGIEVLSSGVINVFRSDNNLYISIKNGAWSIEQVKKEAERLFTLLQEAYVRSALPSNPDYDKINKLCIYLMEEFYKNIDSDGSAEKFIYSAITH